MLVSEFKFELPEEQIAQQPLADRAGARMLSIDRTTGAWEDGYFRNLPEKLREGDLLVLNDSRVIPARLFGRRAARTVAGSGLAGSSPTASSEGPTGRIEVLLTEQVSEWDWKALVRPGRKVVRGERLTFHDSANGSGRLESNSAVLEAEVIDHQSFGERLLRFAPVNDFSTRLERLGHMPLPPYIRRPDEGEDRERYQTIYARARGSVAAPTAGLHFDENVMQQIRVRGVRIAYVTLHVGLGTFQPIRVERIEDIRLHAERYTLPSATVEELNSARHDGRRIIAAGTTTVRTLEHCAALADGYRFEPHSGSTSIFISSGFKFRVVSAMLTNFHLPQSSLLMLVSAFAGHEQVMAAYRHAVAEGYRFFSYGDCMFIS